MALPCRCRPVLQGKLQYWPVARAPGWDEIDGSFSSACEYPGESGTAVAKKTEPCFRLSQKEHRHPSPAESRHRYPLPGCSSCTYAPCPDRPGGFSVEQLLPAEKKCVQSAVAVYNQADPYPVQTGWKQGNSGCDRPLIHPPGNCVLRTYSGSCLWDAPRR